MAEGPGVFSKPQEEGHRAGWKLAPGGSTPDTEFSTHTVKGVGTEEHTQVGTQEHTKTRQTQEQSAARRIYTAQGTSQSLEHPDTLPREARGQTSTSSAQAPEHRLSSCWFHVVKGSQPKPQPVRARQDCSLQVTVALPGHPQPTQFPWHLPTPNDKC